MPDLLPVCMQDILHSWQSDLRADQEVSGMQAMEMGKTEFASSPFSNIKKKNGVYYGRLYNSNWWWTCRM